MAIALPFLSSNALFAQVCSSSNPCVLTQHNDNGRTGLNYNEKTLTLKNVPTVPGKPATFGKVKTLPLDGSSLDGQVMAQPLYYNNHLYVATQHGSVYGFDANSYASLGSVSLLQSNETLPSESEYVGNGNCTDISSIDHDGNDANGNQYPNIQVAKREIGITSTPVIIDTSGATGILYAVVHGKKSDGSHFFRLSAINLSANSGILSTASIITQTEINTPALSNPAFIPSYHHQRAGLLYANGTIYIAFSSLCDDFSYHGWIFGYDATSLKQNYVFVTSPSGTRSGIWMSGAGLTADTPPNNGLTTERIFPVTGNGTVDTTKIGGICLPQSSLPSPDWRDSILRLVPSGTTLKVMDHFTPKADSIPIDGQWYMQEPFCDADNDVGSAGALLAPPHAKYPTYPQGLLVQRGKSGFTYVLDPNNLTGGTGGENTVREIPISGSGASPDFGLWGLPAFWNGTIYIWGASGMLEQFDLGSLADPNGSTTPKRAIDNKSTYGHGITPSISVNHVCDSTGKTCQDSDAILWAVDYYTGPNTSGPPMPQVLYAYDATNISTAIWSSNQNPTDHALGQRKFATPTIAGGRVFVSDGTYDAASDTQRSVISVYGLLAGTSTPTITFNPLPPAVVGTSIDLSVYASATSGLSVSFTVAAGSPATLSGTVLTFNAVGSVTVTASSAGAQSVQKVITVTAGAQTITFNPPSSAVVGTSINLSGYATATPSKLAVTFSISASPASAATLSGTILTFNAVGSVTVTANQAGNANYSAAQPVQKVITVTQGTTTLLAYEPFGEAANKPLQGASGGGDSGWASAWVEQTTSGYQIQSTNPLTYSGLTVPPNRASGGYSYESVGRSLNVSPTGPFSSYLSNNLIGAGQTIWLSFLIREDTVIDQHNAIFLHANQFPWYWMPQSIAIGHLQGTSQSSTYYWGLASLKNQQVTSSVLSKVPVKQGQTVLMVVSIAFGAGTSQFNLYVNPTSLRGAAPAQPDATLSMPTSAAFNAVAYEGGYQPNSGSLGYIRFGTSFSAVTQ